MELDDRLLIKINSDMKKRVEKAAEADNRSMASWIRNVIDKHLKSIQGNR